MSVSNTAHAQAWENIEQGSFDMQSEVEQQLKDFGIDPSQADDNVRQKIQEELEQFRKDMAENDLESMDRKARKMLEKVRKERMLRTIVEAKAGLKVGWPIEHMPKRNALPPTWEEYESSYDHKAWIIYKDVEVQKKKPVSRLAKKAKPTPKKIERCPHLLVNCGGAVQRDGKKWLHVSISQRHGYPSWPDIKMVKSYLLGPLAEAYMVLPEETPQSSAGTVMHFFYCLDSEKENGKMLPDFTAGTGTL